VTSLILLTLFLPLLAALPGGGWVLIALAPLTLYPAFVRKVRAGDTIAAWQLGVLWALLLSAGVILLTIWWPAAARAGIVHGEPYRQEMFGWIATGEAPENDWHRFLPVHLLHFAVFVVLTWVSGGYLGLVLGAFLVAYMSYFVGCYAAASGHPWLGSVAAWVPWSVIRVLAFVLFGALFARPLLVRKIWPFGKAAPQNDYRLMGLAASGIVADLVIKAFGAPAYGLFLRQLARGAAAAASHLSALYSAAPRTF
jgi:hypothetical protein